MVSQQLILLKMLLQKDLYEAICERLSQKQQQTYIHDLKKVLETL